MNCQCELDCIVLSGDICTRKVHSWIFALLMLQQLYSVHCYLKKYYDINPEILSFSPPPHGAPEEGEVEVCTTVFQFHPACWKEFAPSEVPLFGSC